MCLSKPKMPKLPPPPPPAPPPAMELVKQIETPEGVASGRRAASSGLSQLVIPYKGVQL